MDADDGRVGGTTALWSAGTPTYDFNDPTANAVDGGDADNRGGRLSINPAVATITPGGGCSTTGLTLGSSAGFSEGVTDSLTILTAGASADPTCVWDITGLGISQTIPAEQSAGSYAITMVLSVVAS